MPQINFYVPEEVDKRLRIMAKQNSKTLSAFVADIVKQHTLVSTWPDNFFTEVAGCWQGELKEPEDEIEDNEVNL